MNSTPKSSFVLIEKSFRRKKLRRLCLARIRSKRRNHQARREEKPSTVEVSFLSQKQAFMIVLSCSLISTLCTRVSFKSTTCVSQQCNVKQQRILMVQTDNKEKRILKLEVTMSWTSKELRMFSCLRRLELPRKMLFCQTY